MEGFVMGSRAIFKVAGLFFFFACRLQAADRATLPVVGISTQSTPATSLQGGTFTWRTASNTAFQIGEDLHYVVKWGLVVAGYSSLTVPAYDNVFDRKAYHIVSKARSGGMVSAFYKVEDNNEVWLDTQSLVTLRYEKRIKEGKYHIDESTILDQVPLDHESLSLGQEHLRAERRHDAA